MKSTLSNNDTIFATGVFLQPVKCTINGAEQWRWIAVGFEDDSYFAGKCVNPMESANNLENILQGFED